ncbi:MAG: hypothetical protein KAS66_13485 [Candidatus Omnitrophica bacterium]|nr:hypothetical protein [Candidatus Omnitrophota bacterium]
MKKIIFAIIFFHLFVVPNVQASKLDDINPESLDLCREIMIESIKYQCQKFENVDINSAEAVARLFKAREMIRSVNVEYIIGTEKYLENEWDDFFDVPSDVEFLRYLVDLDHDGLLKQKKWLMLLEKKYTCIEDNPEFKKDRDVFDKEYSGLIGQYRSDLEAKGGDSSDLSGQLPIVFSVPGCADSFGTECSQPEKEQAGLAKFAAFVLEKKKYCEFLELN